MGRIAGTARIVVCLLALAATVVVSASAAAAKPAPTTTTTPRTFLAPRRYAPGECITWNARESSVQDSRTVRCDRPHVLEMIGRTVQVRAHRYPTERQWYAFIDAQCTPKVTKYLGQALDSTGRYIVSGIKTGKQRWKRGFRELACAIHGRDAVPHDVNDLIGRVDPADQAALGTAGTCLAVKHKLGPFSVDCRAPHYAEIVGIVNLDGRFDHTPSSDEVTASAQPDCDDLALKYLGQPARNGIEVSPTFLDESRWAAGSHETKCVLVKHEHGDLATLSGSLR